MKVARDTRTIKCPACRGEIFLWYWNLHKECAICGHKKGEPVTPEPED